MSEHITESTGNVFADLGFEPGEAAILHMRAKLMSDLRMRIESSGMTQTEAAQKLGIAQSRVSDLVRGKWEKFSLEMLITLEARMGRQVTLEFAAGAAT
jgi:predicted XRE-type DNA-binding protein